MHHPTNRPEGHNLNTFGCACMNIFGQNNIGTSKSCSCFPLVIDMELTRHLFYSGEEGAHKNTPPVPSGETLKSVMTLITSLNNKKLMMNVQSSQNQGTSKGGWLAKNHYVFLSDLSKIMSRVLCAFCLVQLESSSVTPNWVVVFSRIWLNENKY